MVKDRLPTGMLLIQSTIIPRAVSQCARCPSQGQKLTEELLLWVKSCVQRPLSGFKRKIVALVSFGRQDTRTCVGVSDMSCWLELEPLRVSRRTPVFLTSRVAHLHSLLRQPHLVRAQVLTPSGTEIISQALHSLSSLSISQDTEKV